MRHECPNNTGNLARASILNELDIPEGYDVLSVEADESDRDDIFSISEGEAGAVMRETLLQELEGAFVLIEECRHNWSFDKAASLFKCEQCKLNINQRRVECSECKGEICEFCACHHHKVRKPMEMRLTTYIGKDELIKQLLEYIAFLLQENDRLRKSTEEDFQELERARKGKAIEGEAGTNGDDYATPKEEDDAAVMEEWI